MADEEIEQAEEEGTKLSHEEWLAAERARLKTGFTYTPPPLSAEAASEASAADQILAGLGLGGAAVAGTLAPHPNPITFQGIGAPVIANALRSEISDDDTRVQVDRTDEGPVIVISQSQASAPHNFTPALTVTLLQASESLTVTVSELRKSALRDKWSSIGSTVLDQSREMLGSRRRRGVGSLLDMASSLKDGVEDLVDDIQDLNLPSRVWAVIDRVGGAAEEAYLEDLRKLRAREWEREAAVRAYTHCAWCGRAYGAAEVPLVECPSCGAPRGSKPASLG
jgi:hypothetical protein